MKRGTGGRFGHVGDTRITKKEVQEQKSRPTELALLPVLPTQQLSVQVSFHRLPPLPPLSALFPQPSSGDMGQKLEWGSALPRRKAKGGA